MDQFNEIKLNLIMYHLLLFTMFVPDPEIKYKIGFSCLVFLFIGLAVNMFKMFATPITMFKRWCRLRYFKKRARK